MSRGALTAVRHVWVIDLENQGFAQSFGNPSADPFLARTLPRMGALLENYYAIGHSSAANYIAQISGQAPELATQSDCPLWTPFAGQLAAGPYHQVLGEGCVYPAAAETPGGGRIGAVLLSPLIRPGTVSTVDYNHYSLLRTVEDIFGLPHLGDAAMPQVRSFGADVFG